MRVVIVLNIVRKKQAVVKPGVLHTEVVVDIEEVAAFGAGLLKVLAVIEKLCGLGAGAAAARVLASLKQNRIHAQLESVNGTEETRVASTDDQPVTAFVGFTKIRLLRRCDSELLFATAATSIRTFRRTVGHIGLRQTRPTAKRCTHCGGSSHGGTGSPHKGTAGHAALLFHTCAPLNLACIQAGDNARE